MNNTESTDLRFIIEIDEENKVVRLKYCGSHDDIAIYARNEDTRRSLEMFKSIIS